MTPELTDLRRIADEIKTYFAENPAAAESLEGIVTWWLMRRRFEEAWRAVSAALDLLVAEGILNRTTNIGGDPVYSVRRLGGGEV